MKTKSRDHPVVEPLGKDREREMGEEMGKGEKGVREGMRREMR